MSRNRLFFTAPIVLVIVLIGVFAIRSRGNDSGAKVETKPTHNCPPVARADAAATKPGTPISIDVLANDTDPDGDPLVFQIRKTDGGESTVDDGGTPTDASDDRVLFTPAETAPQQATIDYEALDPTGALSEATVTVVINADGLLPPDIHSDEVPTEQSSGSGCGSGKVSTSTTESIIDGSTTTEVSTPPATGDANGTTATTAKKKPSTKGGHTTTTRRGSTSTTKAPSTTQPHTSTTNPPATTTPPPSTTQPTSPPTTDPCGPFPGFNSPDYQKWKDCEQHRQS